MLAACGGDWLSGLPSCKRVSSGCLIFCETSAGFFCGAYKEQASGYWGLQVFEGFIMLFVSHLTDVRYHAKESPDLSWFSALP